jgi:histidinol dehydrogenase
LVTGIEAEMELALVALPRRPIIEKSLRHSVAVLVADVSEAIAVANEYAPEHLIIQVTEPRAAAAGVSTAGSVFLGRWTRSR